MMNRLMIDVEKISKRYQLGNYGSATLSRDIQSWFQKEKPDLSSHIAGNDLWSLKEVSFQVEQGDIFGIVGKNGAGKSTLLKLLSKITKPSSGRIKLNGTLASLLEVGTGFHPDLTGRENIFLNGAIIGMKSKEIKSKFDAIVQFSGIEKFLDTPVKRYSSGMYVRLGFAVAAHLDPEIMVVDEVLAVGDYEFQQKCLGKMKDVAGDGRTILFVSHSLAALKQLCNKGLLLEKGVVKATGAIDSVLDAYQEKYADIEDGVRSVLPENTAGFYTGWELVGEELPGKHICNSRDNCTFGFSFTALDALKNCEVRLMIKYEALIVFHATSLDTLKGLFNIQRGSYRFQFEVHFPIRDAGFEVEVNLISNGKMIDLWLSTTRLTVLNNFPSRVNPGMLNLPAVFSFEKFSSSHFSVHTKQESFNTLYNEP